MNEWYEYMDGALLLATLAMASGMALLLGQEKTKTARQFLWQMFRLLAYGTTATGSLLLMLNLYRYGIAETVANLRLLIHSAMIFLLILLFHAVGYRRYYMWRYGAPPPGREGDANTQNSGS